MKIPTWEVSAGAVVAFLNSATEIMMADLYVFTTAGGMIYRYTSGDRALSVNGVSYNLGPKIARSEVRTIVGIEVDTLTVDLYAEPIVAMGAIPMIQALAQGAMDNGTLRVERLFMNSSAAQQGSILIFTGRIGQVVTTRGRASIEVMSHTELLDVMIPSGVYQPSCRNTLYDPFCGIDRASKAISTTATAGTGATRQTFSANFTSTVGASAGYFSLGTVKFTTGANAGITRTVKMHSGTGTGLVEVIPPWPYAVAVGDSFTGYPGCDKTKTTCNAKFANTQRFQGEPFIPLPETIT